MSPARLPPLPLMTSDQLLDDFSHKLLRCRVDVNNKALIDQGKTALDFAVTYYLFSRRPIMVADEIPSFRDSMLSEDNLESWIEYYGIHQHLRSNHFRAPSADDASTVFYTYVGAVVEQIGVESVTEWAIQLMNSLNASSQGVLSNKGARGEGANVLAPGHVSVHAFHILCTREHLRVEYQTANHASPHSPVWVVKCLVNGAEKGEGHGPTKKIAKAEAVKQACLSMGWTMD